METYTTLDFGHLTPSGPIRLLAGVESLDGLLLIGWTATSTYAAFKKLTLYSRATKTTTIDQELVFCSSTIFERGQARPGSPPSRNDGTMA